MEYLSPPGTVSLQNKPNSRSAKIGDVWFIPADALKPADMRIKKAVKEPAFPIDDLDIETLYGPDTRQIRDYDVCSIYRTKHGNGTGVVTKYDVFPGIQLFTRTSILIVWITAGQIRTFQEMLSQSIIAALDDLKPNFLTGNLFILAKGIWQ